MIAEPAAEGNAFIPITQLMTLRAGQQGYVLWTQAGIERRLDMIISPNISHGYGVRFMSYTETNPSEVVAVNL